MTVHDIRRLFVARPRDRERKVYYSFSLAPSDGAVISRAPATDNLGSRVRFECRHIEERKLPSWNAILFLHRLRQPGGDESQPTSWEKEQRRGFIDAR